MRDRLHVALSLILLSSLSLLFAGCGGGSIKLPTVNASTSNSLKPSSGTLAFGNVVLNSSATQSVTITSTGGVPVAISSATVAGQGFAVSGSTLPVTLKPGQSLTLNVQFIPSVAGAATGMLTIATNSSASAKTVVNLSGTGVSATSYQITLNWNPPANSTDPVAGYNIYRAPSGGSSYQLVNSAAIVQTSYVDASVQSGASYDYIVESVDALGIASGPSNMVSFALP